MNRLISSILLFFFLIDLSGQGGFDQFQSTVDEWLSEGNYWIEIDVSVHDKKDNSVLQKDIFTYAKYDDNFYSKVLDQELIYDEKFMLKIDHAQAIIAVFSRHEDLASIKSIFSSFSDELFEIRLSERLKDEKEFFLRVKGQDEDYAKMIFEKNSLKEIVLLSSGDFTMPNGEVIHSYTEMKYRYKSAKTFKVSDKYISGTGEHITLTPAFEKFTLNNYTL